MKSKILTVAVILLSSTVSLTAFSQESKTTLPSWQVDSLINRTLDSKEWEHLSDTYREAFIQLGEKWRESERRNDTLANNIAKLDSGWRAYANAVTASRDAASFARDSYRADLEKQRLKNKRAWGVGLQVGYNPFTRLPMAGVGLSLNVFRFSLRGMFSDSGEAPANTAPAASLGDMLRR